MKTLTLLLLLMVVSAPTLSACGGGVDCTEIGCSSGVGLAVSRADQSAFPAGQYHVSIDFGGGDVHALTCDYVVSGGPVSCSQTGVDNLFGEFDGGLLSLSYHGTYDEPVTSDPYRVVITQDGSPIVDETYGADFTMSQPNGPQCDPTCYWADETASATVL